MRAQYKSGVLLTLAFAAAGSIISLLLGPFLRFSSDCSGPDPTVGVSREASDAADAVRYMPPRPDEAPAPIRDAVLLGYRIMTETRKNLGTHVGNGLDCRSCHFDAGITQGGRNGGLSLVGVAAKYPAFRSRQNYAVDLTTRTNDCFQRSMNGTALPPDSREMTALLTYYQWISRGIPIYSDVPWLEQTRVTAPRPPDAAAGAALYARRCAMCHGEKGQGMPAGPPLWGGRSFNDGAGMARLPVFAAFVKHNMPRENPDLTDQQAADLAAFATRQPRPRFAARSATTRPR